MNETIVSNPVYIRERQMHKMYCDGFGKITHINSYTRETSYSDCPMCKRLAIFRDKQKLKQLENANG